MIYTVYGIRLTDDSEVRYVGFTRFTPEIRLHRHLIDTSYGTPGRMFRQWLLPRADRVEAFTICKTKTEANARLMEKAAIAAMVLRRL